MSSEQSDGVTHTAPAVAANSQADITQQETTPTPTTATQCEKNPKRVAAGKRVAERTRIAREQQKKAAAEASVIIANNNAKTTASPPEPAPTTGLSTNQWIAVGGLAVSLGPVFITNARSSRLHSRKTRLNPRPPVLSLRHSEKV